MILLCMYCPVKLKMYIIYLIILHFYDYIFKYF